MEISKSLKLFWDRSVKTVKKAGTSIVGATRYKMDEMSSVSRRRELITELGEKAYGLSLAGTAMPEDLAPLLKEIEELESGLAELRSDRAAVKAAAAEAAAADKAAYAEERAAAKAAAAEARAAAKAAKAEAEALARAEAEAAAAAAEAAVEAVEEDAAPVLEVEAEAEEGPVYSGEMPTEEDAPVLEVKDEA